MRRDDLLIKQRGGVRRRRSPSFWDLLRNMVLARGWSDGLNSMFSSVRKTQSGQNFSWSDREINLMTPDLQGAQMGNPTMHSSGRRVSIRDIRHFGQALRKAHGRHLRTETGDARPSGRAKLSASELLHNESTTGTPCCWTHVSLYLRSFHLNPVSNTCFYEAFPSSFALRVLIQTHWSSESGECANVIPPR